MNNYNQLSDINEASNIELNNFENNQSLPINSSAHNPNYNATHDTEFGAMSPHQETGLGLEGGFNVTNTVPKFHNEHQMEWWLLVWRNFEQIKSISAGLLLLFCGGIHTVWAIYQIIFYQMNAKFFESRENDTKIKNYIYGEVHSLKIAVSMYYFGIMTGSAIVGYYLLPEIRKKNIYYFAALSMFISSSLFFSASVEETGWQHSILFARLFAGISHGLVYVTIFVQTSENSIKEFRQTMIVIISGVIASSLLFASLFIITIPETFDVVAETFNFKSTEITSAEAIFLTTLFFCFVSVVINYFYTYETVPFLLKHNCRDDEVIYVLAKLQDESPDSVVIQNDFEAIRHMCENDYLEYPERKIFTRNNRKLLMFAMYARLCGLVAVSVPAMVNLIQFLLSSIEKDMDALKANNATIENAEKLQSDYGLHHITVRAVLFLWFSVGYALTIASAILNWKRTLYAISSVMGLYVILSSIFIWMGMLKPFFFHLSRVVVTVYFKFLSLPIDFYGYTFLAECFPVPTKSWSIGFITCVENLVHIIFIFCDWTPREFNHELFVMGIILIICAFMLYVTAPDTAGLAINEAQQLYLESSRSQVGFMARVMGVAVSKYKQ